MYIYTYFHVCTYMYIHNFIYTQQHTPRQVIDDNIPMKQHEDIVLSMTYKVDLRPNNEF